MSSYDEIDTKKKLPLKSTSGRRCLTKCYQKGTEMVHPFLLTATGSKAHDFCAIDPVYSKDPMLGIAKFNMIFIDKCRQEDNKIYQPPDELESILLGFYFNPNDFLENMYGLYSFDQVIYWTLENDHLPFDTIKRVHNSAWKAFGSKIESITNTVVDYYYDIAKNHWLYDYAKTIQNKYSFNLVSNKENLTIMDTYKKIYEILASKFFSYDFFNTSIKKYVYMNLDDWDHIDSHYGKLKNFIFGQLVEHIENETNA